MDDVRCSNFELCQNIVPRWVAESRCVIGLCVNCDVGVRKILVFSTANCCVCLNEQVRSANFWTCEHKICLRCHYFNVPNDGAPQCLQNDDFDECECVECAEWLDNYESQQNVCAEAIKNCPLCRAATPVTY